jgi:VanZ family protein
MTYPLLMWRLATATSTGIILYLALTPSPSSSGFGWDKANHAATMAVMTVLAFLSLQPARRPILYSAGYALGLGILIEMLQGFFTQSRSAEWGDLLADTVGVFMATLVLQFWLHKKRLNI